MIKDLKYKLREQSADLSLLSPNVFMGGQRLIKNATEFEKSIII